MRDSSRSASVSGRRQRILRAWTMTDFTRTIARRFVARAAPCRSVRKKARVSTSSEGPGSTAITILGRNYVRVLPPQPRKRHARVSSDVLPVHAHWIPFERRSRDVSRA